MSTPNGCACAQIRAGMAQRHVSPALLSQRTGIPITLVDALVNGVAPVTVDDLRKIATAPDTSATILLETALDNR